MEGTTPVFRCLGRLRETSATTAYLAIDPKPLVVVEAHDELDAIWSDVDFLGFALGHLLLGSERYEQTASAGRQPILHRCVSFERLPVILRTGCDVVPPDSPLHAAPPGYKPGEYGGKEKILLVFRGSALEGCTKLVPRSTETAQLETLRKLFPFERLVTHPSMIEVSRIPFEQIPNLYTMWIPGDPWDALLAIVVAGGQRSELVRRTAQLVSDCPDRHWSPILPVDANEAVKRLHSILSRLSPND